MGKREATAYIEPFLINNGFIRDDKKVIGGYWIRFINENQCEIYIHEEQEHYKVVDKNGFHCYSDNLSIFWLIGILIYFGFIKPNEINLDGYGTDKAVFYEMTGKDDAELKQGGK